MTITVGTSSGNKAVNAITVGTSSGNKAVLNAWVGTSSGNKLIFTAFSVSLSHTNSSGAGAGVSSISVTTSPAITVNVSGGSGSYSYAWRRVSGDTQVNVDNPSSATTAATVTVPPNTLYSAVFVCDVTDTVLGVTETTGQATFTAEHIGSGA